MRLSATDTDFRNSGSIMKPNLIELINWEKDEGGKLTVRVVTGFQAALLYRAAAVLRFEFQDVRGEASTSESSLQLVFSKDQLDALLAVLLEMSADLEKMPEGLREN
jgi:hypothetical protein